jgi:hypothetical protein
MSLSIVFAHFLILWVELPILLHNCCLQVEHFHTQYTLSHEFWLVDHALHQEIEWQLACSYLNISAPNSYHVTLFLFALTHLFFCTARSWLLVYDAHSHVTYD